VGCSPLSGGPPPPAGCARALPLRPDSAKTGFASWFGSGFRENTVKRHVGVRVGLRLGLGKTFGRVIELVRTAGAGQLFWAC
jgi:hypothetical protein